jgi:hypothetical protein
MCPFHSCGKNSASTLTKFVIEKITLFARKLPLQFSDSIPCKKLPKVEL